MSHWPVPASYALWLGGLMQVLIVDDRSASLTFMKYLVKKLGDTEVICFPDSVSGLQWSTLNEPDLLIVDFMMPEMDGVKLAISFRKLYRDVPVLMVTADHHPELRRRALQSGVTDFLRKPFERVEFTARVKNMLALRANHKESSERVFCLAKEMREATNRLVDQERNTIFCLARAAEYRDPETGSHILRMAHYSRHIAKMIGLSIGQQDLLLEAAPMHDIGKVATPDAILLKRGRLTDEEFAVMKLHAEIGHKILSTVKTSLLETAAEIAHTHHEKFDGSGYPRGLKGSEIPLFGRIVAVADVFDALTSRRPYKTSWKIDDAAAHLKECRGTHFDPICVDAFLEDWDAVMDIRKKYDDTDHELETMHILHESFLSNT